MQDGSAGAGLGSREGFVWSASCGTVKPLGRIAGRASEGFGGRPDAGKGEGGKMSKDTESRFLNDVADLQMAVLRDDGLFRHVQFKNPKSFQYRFDLITWPGRLCIDGDMGTYVFSRIADMFEFFRTKPDDAKGIFINLGYWAEKVLAQDKNGGIMKYSADVAEARVIDHLSDLEQCGRTISDELRSAIQDEVIAEFLNGEHEAHRALSEFEWEGKQFFHDTWEWNLREYDYSYTWCCYAISWGIRQYDELKLAVKS